MGKPVGGDGQYQTDTWLGMPGTSHFRLVSDESGVDAAPSGLALLSAGIAFCYMTQLSRYIENMKMNIHGVRLVQFNPYVAGARAVAEPIDMHLFLNGEATEETHLRLLTIAARTCYLHAASKTPPNQGSYRPQRKRYSSCGVVTADKTIGNRLLAPAPPLPKC